MLSTAGGHAAAAAVLVGHVPPPAGAQQRGRLGPRPPGGIPRAREWLYLESVQINLLSANTHNSSGWRSGSGLYSSEGALAYYHDTAEAAGGRLLIADLDIKPAKVI